LDYVIELDNDGIKEDVTVSFIVTGTNDSPAQNYDLSIGAGGAGSANETTDSSNITASATATFFDIDTNDQAYTAQALSVTSSGVTTGFTATDAELLAMISNITVNNPLGQTTGEMEVDFSSDSTVFDYLATGETIELTYVIELDNDGIKTTNTVKFTINGTNDAPIVTSFTNGTGVETTDTSDITSSANVEFSDVDLNDDGYTASITAVSSSGENGGLSAVADADLIAMIGNLGVTKAAGSSTGSVNPSFTGPSGTFDYLAAGETVTLTYTMQINDGDGGTVDQDFTIEITGTNDTTKPAQKCACGHLRGRHGHFFNDLIKLHCFPSNKLQLTN